MCRHYEVISQGVRGELIGVCKLCGRTRNYSELQEPYGENIYSIETQATINDPISGIDRHYTKLFTSSNFTQFHQHEVR